MLMVPWEMSRRNPMIDIRMVATRQFGTCFVVMLATGAMPRLQPEFLQARLVTFFSPPECLQLSQAK
jgi:MFS transporter, DHA2 family, multidrug resistance protein